MTTWALVRLLKWVFVLAFGAGALGAALGRDPRDRRLAAYGLLTTGFIGSWLLGYAMLEMTERSMGDRWVSMAMLTSMIAFGAGLAASGSSAARRIWSGTTVAATVATMGLMTIREAGGFGTVYGIAVVAGIAGAALVGGDDGEDPVPHTWFAWVARLEGVSLIALFGVAMPLKYVWGYPEAVKLAGMFHGVLFLAYLIALGRTGAVARWDIWPWLLGLVASFVPFGTFGFEWYLARRAG